MAQPCRFLVACMGRSGLRLLPCRGGLLRDQPDTAAWLTIAPVPTNHVDLPGMHLGGCVTGATAIPAAKHSGTATVRCLAATSEDRHLMNLSKLQRLDCVDRSSDSVYAHLFGCQRLVLTPPRHKSDVNLSLYSRGFYTCPTN